jgi:F0F1-type ATP synthase epsilon subunit
MSRRQALHVVIRTPREVVLEHNVASLRVPTQTGQVGLRPRCEPAVLAIEPGLILLRRNGDFRYAGTAGGLLRCTGEEANLLTPLAVIGDVLEQVQAELEQALSEPSEEMEVRSALTRLETNILQELHRGEQRLEARPDEPK